MDDSNNSNQNDSQNIDILSLARVIYELLSINKEIENEDKLFSDEVYLEIISKIIPDIQEEINPGSTPEEKVEVIKALLSLLGNLVEANLSNINAKKIVLDHDKESVKNFLELLLELINAIINNGGEEEEEEENTMVGTHNLSEEKIRDERIKSSSFDEDKKLNNFNKEDEINIDDLESLKLSRDNKNEKSKKKLKEKSENEESEEMKLEGNSMLDKEKTQSEKDLKIEKEKNEENKSNSKVLNVSHISDDIKIDKKNSDQEDNNYISNSQIDNDNPKNIKLDENKYNFQGSDDDLSSNNLKESAYSVPPPFKKPLLTNNSSEAYGDSLLKKENEKKKKKNEDKEDDDFDLNYNDELYEKNLNLNVEKNSNTSLLNSNISLHSKSKKSNRINDSKLENSSNKKGSSKKKNSILGGNKISKNESSKKGSRINTNKSKNEMGDDISESSQSNDVSKSSVYTIHQGSSQKNSKISKKIEKKNSKSNLNKSNNSKKSSVKEKTRSSCSTIINSEIPLDDKGFKFELIKELKKIYGNKIGKALQGPNNSYSNLDLILQDLKFAKKQEKQMRKEQQQNSESKEKDKEKISLDKYNELNNEDALLNKEFLIKNQKQLQLMLQIYNQKFKKRQMDQERYARDIGQNIQFMRKIKDLELKKLENEIERKKELNENNAPEEIFFCKKVFENYYQLEEDKIARELDSIQRLNDMKLTEKAKNIFDIDRYYKDKIAILNEIGRRERKENKRRKMEDNKIYLQLKSIPKRELKKKMKQIINSIDDDFYNNVEVDNNNQEEIEKILDNYYKK